MTPRTAAIGALIVSLVVAIAIAAILLGPWRGSSERSEQSELIPED